MTQDTQTVTTAPNPAATAATDHPDAELLGMCEQFNNLERLSAEAFALEGRIDDFGLERITTAINQEQEPIIERIVTCRAATVAGMVARARIVAGWRGADATAADEKGTWEDRMLAALLRDLLAMAGVKETANAAG